MSCDQCEAAMINGVFCHETGCPNSRKRFIDGEWVKVWKCFECGCETTDENCCVDEEWEEFADFAMSHAIC